MDDDGMQWADVQLEEHSDEGLRGKLKYVAAFWDEALVLLVLLYLAYRLLN